MTTSNIRARITRMGHVAKRNMGLTEKTQVLSNDLREVEKRVELIQHACQKTTVKLQKCLQGAGQDVEKRTRKLPYSVLGQVMQDTGQELGETSVFGLALGRTSEACTSIAGELTSHEMGIENLVLAPFNHIIEDDIPSIQTQRKKLKSLTIDMEAAKSSLMQAQRATSGGRNMTEHALKVDLLRENYDTAQTKVESCKESLATLMMTLVSKEGQFARNLLDMVEAQAQYHRNALVRLEGLIPKMKELLEHDPAQPVYGIPLEEHLALKDDREIAEPIQTCIFWLIELGLDEEGLFRIAGTTTKVKMIKAAFDSNTVLDMNDLYGSVNAVAGALKQYLRDLPEPLLTFKLHDEFMQAGSIKDNDQKLQALWTAVNKMPKPNYNNFRYLIRFIDRVAKRSDVNKMTAANLAIVFAPNLMWSKEEGGVSVLSTGIGSAIIELFIAYAEWFFPGDIDFEGPVLLTKSNSFSETNSQSSSDLPEMRSPSPITTPNSHTPEKLSQGPPSPLLQSSSSQSNAAQQLMFELQSQTQKPVKPPPPQQDGQAPAIPERSSKRVRRLSSFSKQQEELRKLLASVRLRLKTASLPRRSTKSRHAPPIPVVNTSPPPSLKRRSVDSGINNSNDTINSIESLPSPPTPPQIANKPPRPPKGSLVRDSRPPTSPVSPVTEVAPILNVASVPAAKPKMRPTISPPPPPKVDIVDNQDSCDTPM